MSGARTPSDLDPTVYKALDDALWAFIRSELRRLEGAFDLPNDRRFLLDRRQLTRIFAAHGFTPEQFGLELDELDDFRLIPELRIVHADIGIYSQLADSFRSWREDGLIPLT